MGETASKMVFEGTLANAIDAEARAWKKAPEKLIQQALGLLAQERERRHLEKLAKEPTRSWRDVKKELAAS